MKVALFFEARPLVRSDAGPADIYNEFETLETIQSIAFALESLGHTVFLVDSQRDPLRVLAKLKGTADVVFNTSVGFGTRFREMMAAAICEAVGINYTGSDPMAQALTANKHVAKLLASSAGIPTPAWTTVSAPEDVARATSVAERVIIKPMFEGSSIGVTGPYETADATYLMTAVAETLERYRQPVIVEAFVAGYEVTAPVLGNPPRALPPVGLMLDGSFALGSRVFSADIKTDPTADVVWASDLPLPDATLNAIKRSTITAHLAFGCRDLSRCDYRVAPDGSAYLIEVNATPQVAPSSSMVVSASLAGLRYEAFLNCVIASASER
jgi:D-alanine-D-alanine ligase